MIPLLFAEKSARSVLIFYIRLGTTYLTKNDLVLYFCAKRCSELKWVRETVIRLIVMNNLFVSEFEKVSSIYRQKEFE